LKPQIDLPLVRHFFRDELKYLGHIVSARGIHPGSPR